MSSPERFRLWTAIHAVGSAAERRVWTKFGANNTLFPNLFVFMVAPPGIGKTQAIKPITALLRKSNACELSPNDMTKQGLLDTLYISVKGAIIDNEAMDYAYLACYISELTNFMAKYDIFLAGVLTDLWDCLDINEEAKRHMGGKSKAVSFPGVSLLIGTATGSLGSIIPHEMWDSGFMARVILVYEDTEVVLNDVFEEHPFSQAAGEEIVEGFKEIGQMKGPIPWTPEARDLLNEFRKRQRESETDHARLTHYNSRRWLQVGKLSMIAALSELRFQVIERDIHTALHWLLPTEARIPEIFRNMINSADGALIEELCHSFKDRTARSPITVGEMYRFFGSRSAANRINQLIDVAINGDYLARVAGTSGPSAQYFPLRRN